MNIQYYKKLGLIKSSQVIFSKFGYALFSKLFFFIMKKLHTINPNRIVFFSVPDFSDNARELYEYMEKQNISNKYEIIWLVNHFKEALENKENTKQVKVYGKYHERFTFKALFYAMTSRYIFVTHGSPIKKYYKNPNQTVINLWHGCGYKQSSSTKLTKFSSHNDYYLVPGNLFIKPKSKFWKISEDSILPLGYPRYEQFKNNSYKAEEYINKLKDNESTRVIIWMPTFRQSKEAINYPESKIQNGKLLPLINSEEDLKYFNEHCRLYNTILIIKKHPLQLALDIDYSRYSNIIFINDDTLSALGIQLYELLPFTDGLISDYSSIAIDYLLLNKPIAFLLNDFSDYQSTRGFVFDNPLDYMPGHHIYKIDELYSFVSSVSRNEDIYINQRVKLIKEAHNLTENYSRKVLDYFDII